MTKIEVDPETVARAMHSLADADIDATPAVVKQALAMWLADECERLASHCTDHRGFLRWLDYEVRHPRRQPQEVMP